MEWFIEKSNVFMEFMTHRVVLSVSGEVSVLSSFLHRKGGEHRFQGYPSWVSTEAQGRDCPVVTHSSSDQHICTIRPLRNASTTTVQTALRALANCTFLPPLRCHWLFSAPLSRSHTAYS